MKKKSKIVRQKNDTFLWLTVLNNGENQKNVANSGYFKLSQSALPACSGSAHSFDPYIVHQKRNHTEWCGFSFWYGIRDWTRTNPMRRALTPRARA
jgi:hypothetical protein